jgi:16S rRNA (cytidine1402-2'-O)-methyltransferase
MTEDPCADPSDTPVQAPQLFKKPGLVLVSTPIGNLGDFSARGLAALRQADVILCEDTRTSARLLRHFGVATRTMSLHDHNEAGRVPEILARLQDGALAALISDAGTPLVSDPGYRLVRAAIEAGITVTATPGANAAVTALTLSGLPPHPFLFLGFLPPRQAARLAALAKLRAAELAGLTATLVLYESPHRAGECLADLAAIFGDRPAALTRELTKLFEDVQRGTLHTLAALYATTEPRGEVTIVVGPPDTTPDAADLDTLLHAALKTQTLREAAAGIAEATGLPRKQVYARALALRDSASPGPAR